MWHTFVSHHWLEESTLQYCCCLDEHSNTENALVSSHQVVRSPGPVGQNFVSVGWQSNSFYYLWHLCSICKQHTFWEQIRAYHSQHSRWTYYRTKTRVQTISAVASEISPRLAKLTYFSIKVLQDFASLLIIWRHLSYYWFRVMKSKSNSEELQKDLFKLGDCSTLWQIQFNLRMYKMLHIEAESPNSPTIPWWGLSCL